MSIAGDTLTIEFAPAAAFHRARVDDPKNLLLLRDALFEVTGRKLAIETAVGETPEAAVEAEERLSEEGLISLLKDTFDAEEVEEH